MCFMKSQFLTNHLRPFTSLHPLLFHDPWSWLHHYILPSAWYFPSLHLLRPYHTNHFPFVSSHVILPASLWSLGRLEAACYSISALSRPCCPWRSWHVRQWIYRARPSTCFALVTPELYKPAPVHVQHTYNGSRPFIRPFRRPSRRYQAPQLPLPSCVSRSS